MKNILVVLWGLLFFLYIGVNRVWAVTTSISNTPAVIGQDPFNLTVSITGAKAAKNYLRVDIFKEETSEYKGQTFNGVDWYDGEDAIKYYPIDIPGSETNIATISARLSTIPTSWSNQDLFRLRVRRYTASGSYTSSEAEASSIPILINIPSPTPTPTSVPSPLPTTEITGVPSPSVTSGDPSPIENIYITEAMVAPESGQNEWVELYNDNNESVTLSNWYIDDMENSGSSPKQFSTIIDPHSYAIIELSSALFNNDGDTVRLINSLQQQQDYFFYILSEKGKSIGRNDLNSRSVCIELPTKSERNANCTSEVLSSVRQLIFTPGDLGESIGVSSSEVGLEETIATNTVTKIPLNRPVIGDRFQQPTPFSIQGKLSSPILKSIFPNKNLSRLVKATATSSAGISLLNIAYILYRMKKWHLSEI